MLYRHEFERSYASNDRLRDNQERQRELEERQRTRDIIHSTNSTFDQNH